MDACTATDGCLAAQMPTALSRTTGHFAAASGRGEDSPPGACGQPKRSPQLGSPGGDDVGIDLTETAYRMCYEGEYRRGLGWASRSADC
jgi:hypothetical protein